MIDKTETPSDPMSIATEAVKRALIGVTQDGGCKPETIALVHEAVKTWDTVESEVCAGLRNQLATANDTIRILHQNLQDRSKEVQDLTAKMAKQAATIAGLEELVVRLDEATKATELRNKREIRIGYNKENNHFTVTFRSGQQIHFDRPKSITGNMENWLATLRHQVLE